MATHFELSHRWSRGHCDGALAFFSGLRPLWKSRKQRFALLALRNHKGVLMSAPCPFQIIQGIPLLASGNHKGVVILQAIACPLFHDHKRVRSLPSGYHRGFRWFGWLGLVGWMCRVGGAGPTFLQELTGHLVLGAEAETRNKQQDGPQRRRAHAARAHEVRIRCVHAHSVCAWGA